MCQVSYADASWAVATSLWATVTSFGDDVVSVQDVQELCGLLKKNKSSDSTAVKSFQVKEKKRKREKSSSTDF